MYPHAVKPPPDVNSARNRRNLHVLQSATWGILLRASVIAFEFTGYLFVGSSALLMDALAGLADIIFSLSLIASIKLASRAPDENHPFGHGRYEPLVGMQLGLLLSLMGGFMLFEQIFHLAALPTHEVSPYAWLFALVAIIILETAYQVTMRTAKKHDSPALASDALHYRIDSVTSMIAMIALVIAAFIPDWGGIIDHLGALFIATFMIGIGLYASKLNLNQLIDAVPDRQYFDRVIAAAKKVPGVFGTEKTRIQQYGPDAHVDIDIEVDPLLTVDYAHGISQKVRAEIIKEWPAVRDVTVHIEPYYPNDH